MSSNVVGVRLSADRILKFGGASIMRYLQRFVLASVCAYVVLFCFSLAMKLPSEVNADSLLAVTVGALACCLIAGLISALLVRKNVLVMVITAQVLSIVLPGIAWRL